MSRWFIATLPISNGKPRLPQALEDRIIDPAEDYTEPPGGAIEAVREGTSFRLNQVPPAGTTGRPEMKSLVGRYLGRLDEGQFGTTGRPAIIVCTGSKSALQWLRSNVADPDSGAYRFKSLAEAWQVENVRDWLKANGMPWLPGEFGPDPGSTYGRPTLPVVYCGQGHDVFAPEVP